MKRVMGVGIGILLMGSALFGFEHIKDLKDFSKKTAKGNVIVEFYGTWCGPCKEMKKNLQKINRRKEKVKIYQVDIDKAQDVVDMYGTPQVPAILYMKDGEILQGYVGLKMMPELKSDIKRYFHTKSLQVASQDKQK
ncbi:MAG TPA: thioredoxin [Campylobacteraceae bacterium]|jgi:thioredoxin-like negative regulator of GroEL|nr:thioredoxin [Campylobacteraceae bacterium]